MEVSDCMRELSANTGGCVNADPLSQHFHRNTGQHTGKLGQDWLHNKSRRLSAASIATLIDTLITSTMPQIQILRLTTNKKHGILQKVLNFLSFPEGLEPPRGSGHKDVEIKQHDRFRKQADSRAKRTAVFPGAGRCMDAWSAPCLDSAAAHLAGDVVGLE